MSPPFENHRSLGRQRYESLYQDGILLTIGQTEWFEDSRRRFSCGSENATPDLRWYDYTPDGLVSAIHFQVAGGILPKTLQQAMAYDAANRVKTVTDNVSGAVTTRTYDNREMLASLETRTSSGSLLSGFSYLRDPEGNLSSQTISHAADTTTIAYAHDGLSRLTSENWTGATVYQGTYAYDLAGNRIRKGFGFRASFVRVPSVPGFRPWSLATKRRNPFPGSRPTTDVPRKPNLESRPKRSCYNALRERPQGPDSARGRNQLRRGDGVRLHTRRGGAVVPSYP